MTGANARSEPGGGARLGQRAVEAVLVWYVSLLVVWLGMRFGEEFVPRSRHPAAEPGDGVSRWLNWDGRWYLQIAQKGYEYQPDKPSRVAFFPLYPLTARAVSRLGIPLPWALVLVANAAFLGSLMLLQGVVGELWPRRAETASAAILVAAFWPVGLFFRMGYTESLFLLLSLGVYWGMQRRWPVVWIALLAGAVSAVRPVGIAWLPAVVWHVARRYPSWKDRASWWLICTPLAASGLLVYMGYLAWAFEEPWAFALTQRHWSAESLSVSEKLRSLLTLRPLWELYWGGPETGWQRGEFHSLPEFSFWFLNPVVYVLVVTTVGWGWWRGWLDAEAGLFAAGVLLIPYLTKAAENHMLSFARFSLVAFPVYWVWGRWLAALPRLAAVLLLVPCGALLAMYAALFAAWHQIY